MTHQPPFDRSGLKCRFPTSCTGLLLSPGWSKEEEQESNKDEKLSSLSQTPHPPPHTPHRPHYQSCFRWSHHCNDPSLTSLGVRSRPQQYSLFSPASSHQTILIPNIWTCWFSFVKFHFCLIRLDKDRRSQLMQTPLPEETPPLFPHTHCSYGESADAETRGNLAI